MTKRGADEIKNAKKTKPVQYFFFFLQKTKI